MEKSNFHTKTSGFLNPKSSVSTYEYEGTRDQLSS